MKRCEMGAAKGLPAGIHSPGTAVVETDVVRRRSGRRPSLSSDWVAREEPLEVRVRGRSLTVTMRTPGHDAELAAGFLLTEGLIRERPDVTGMTHCPAAAAPQNTLNVHLAASARVDFASLTRHVFASSSCGLCGKATIDSVHQHFPPVTAAATTTARTVGLLPGRMRRAQEGFARTGGLHAAAVFDTRGRLIVVREDVGRHNAVDKVIGHGFLAGLLPFEHHILLVSGRASFEILQKALAARVPIVCAVSAPSSLAVDFARASGQTLIGFLRDGGMNIYTAPERIRPRAGS